MATTPYDAAKHHVGLGEAADSLVGLLLEGSYRSTLQPAVAPSSFGSGVDYLNNPSLSRWAQDDFSGGAFNYLWGEDTAMFAYCTAMLPTLLGQTIRTAPPIVQQHAKNDQSDIVLAFARGSVLYLIRPTEIQTYDTANDTWLVTPSPASGSLTAAVYDAGAELLYLASDKVYVVEVPSLQPPGRSATATVTIASPGVVTLTAHGLSVDDVVFFSTDGALPTGLSPNTLYWIKEVVDADTFKLTAKKGGDVINTSGTQSGTHTIYYRPASKAVGYVPTRANFGYPETDGFTTVNLLANGRAFIAAACDTNRLFTLSIPTSRAGSPIWTENTRLPGPWRDYAVYNGSIYILCADGFNNTSIYTFDGANLIPITDFPYNFEGVCISVYAGRVYVGGAGRDISGNRSYAELYEITGATLRLVKTFTPEVRDGGQDTPYSQAAAITSMGVFEGLLYLGLDGCGLVAYDVTTDALFGASQFQDTVPGSSVWEMFTTNQTLNLWVDSTLTARRGLYRIATIGETVNPYTGQVVTSDFAPLPTSEKRWSELRVVSRYGDVDVEYSEDGGVTYSALAGTKTEEGSYHFNTVDLSALAVSKHIRFRFSMARSTDSSSYTELVGFTLGFLFLSTGKRTWAVTVNATAAVQALDGTTENVDPAAILSTLSDWASERTSLVYRDVDGSDARVSITRFENFKPVVGLPLDSSRGLEGFYALTLTEV